MKLGRFAQYASAALFLLMLGICCGSPGSFEGDRYQISGTVRYQSGVEVPGAIIQVKDNLQEAGDIASITDSIGNFQLRINHGSYTLLIQKEGKRYSFPLELSGKPRKRDMEWHIPDGGPEE